MSSKYGNFVPSRKSNMAKILVQRDQNVVFKTHGWHSWMLIFCQCCSLTVVMQGWVSRVTRSDWKHPKILNSVIKLVTHLEYLNSQGAFNCLLFVIKLYISYMFDIYYLLVKTWNQNQWTDLVEKNNLHGTHTVKWNKISERTELNKIFFSLVWKFYSEETALRVKCDDN